MSVGEALQKDRQRHTALQGMTLFLTWQSAELNSRPLTRRQLPLKEGCTDRMAGLFKLKVVGTQPLTLLWLVPQSLQRSEMEIFSLILLLHFIFVVHICN